MNVLVVAYLLHAMPKHLHFIPRNTINFQWALGMLIDFHSFIFRVAMFLLSLKDKFAPHGNILFKTGHANGHRVKRAYM